MSKKPKVRLAEALKQSESPQTELGAPNAPAETEVGHKNVAPSRQGKRNVSGYFSQEVHRQLRVIAAEEDKSLQDVLGDAINVLFERKGKPPIA